MGSFRGGFEPPHANVLWCPNQFLDVVLPCCARGVVRVVGYLLWKTFAWNDAAGEPRRSVHALRWAQWIAGARVSRGALGPALEEAQRRGFLAVRPASAGVWPGNGSAPAAPRYRLHFAPGPYQRTLDGFAGFYLGRGHRTYVPNQFFTHVIAHEPLAVARVVGAVIRYSIGFEAERGLRRTAVAFPVRSLARATHLSVSRVHGALRRALARGYLRRVEPGQFGRGARRPALAARYALRWADGFEPETARAQEDEERATRGDTGSETRTAPVQKGQRQRFRKVNGDKEKKIKLLNETPKQQDPTASQDPLPRVDSQPRRSAVAATGTDAENIFRVSSRLRELGFLGRSLDALASYPLERIERQAAWLPARKPARNGLGLLRRAIEEDWPAPVGATLPSPAAAAVNSDAMSGPASTPSPPMSEPKEEAALRVRYRAALCAEIERCAREMPQRYAEFEAYRATLKSQLAFLHRNDPSHGILRHWDDAATRAAHWRQFDARVPDFVAWCRLESAHGPERM